MSLPTNKDELREFLLGTLDELEAMFEGGKTVGFRDMDAYIAGKEIPHLDGYLRRCGALDYQSPKRYYQQGLDLEDVRVALKDGGLPRGLENLFAGY